MNKGRNNIRYNEENFAVVTPDDEGNDTTNVIIKSIPTSGDDQIANARTQFGVWNWLRENCYVPFIASFQQQLFSDVVLAGIHIFPLIPIGYLFNRSIQTMKPCQDMSQSEMEGITAKLRNRNQNRGWKEKIFSLQGIFILSLLTAICLVGITEDDHRSPTRPSYPNRPRSYGYNNASHSLSDRNTNTFRSLNNKPSNMQTNSLDKSRQGPKNSTNNER